MNPQMMQYGQPGGPAPYPPQPQPNINTQMQGLAINQRPPQIANGAPPGGAPQQQAYRPPGPTPAPYNVPQGSLHPVQNAAASPQITPGPPKQFQQAAPQGPYPTSPAGPPRPQGSFPQTAPQSSYPTSSGPPRPQGPNPQGAPQNFAPPGPQKPQNSGPQPTPQNFNSQAPNYQFPGQQMTGQNYPPSGPPQSLPPGPQGLPQGGQSGAPQPRPQQGFPGPTPTSPYNAPQQTGYTTQNAQPPQGFPPRQPAPPTGPPTNSGYPQPAGYPPQPGFPPANSPYAGSQPANFPPGAQQNAGYPPQPGSQPPTGYPPQPGTQLQSQPPTGYPSQSGAQLQSQPPTGYPPQPGAFYPPQQGMPPQQGYGTGQYGPPQQKAQYPQESRRIEPDQLPSVIQVMQDDEKAHSGIFVTNQQGLVPPLMTTNFTVQDGGNCSPRFMRSTMYSVPFNSDMMKQTAVPFAISISPLARLAEGELPPPLVDMGELGPVRCVRCKAYMCPFMQFVDGGRKFQCLLCKASTDVPPQYFQHLDHTGLRTDRFERPELVLGAFEFVAPKEYCKNDVSPNPPAIVFLIDVSYNNVRNGLMHLLCARMRQVLQFLPPGQRVGFITYSSSVHFYNIKSCLAAPQMAIVGDVQEMFMPLLDGFLADPVESAAVIEQLMEEIPRQFSDTRETETILLPALRAGVEALKAANCAGKLIVFHSSLPSAEAPGKLKNRDDRKLLGGEKEKSVLMPQNRVYNELGQDCVGDGVGVDLFVFNNSYIDLATIGQVSRMTGGEIFKYTYFQADIDGDRFIEDLKMDISREVAYDAIMRVRTSAGTRPTDFYGHMFMQNTTDIELACIDSDKSIVVDIKHDDKLAEQDGVYIQVALLYTHVSGQRRLRILNLSLKVCSQMADMYRCADLDTLINFFAKQGVTKLLELTPKQVKENLTTRCATTLACYRKNCASPSGMGQLILPECMKLLPLYINTLIKSDALSGGSDMTVDDRSFAMYAVMVMDVNLSIVYFYPRLIPLHTEPPYNPIRCSIERLQDDGIYLLDNGIYMFLWLGMAARGDLITQLFGVGNSGQVDADRVALPELDNPFSHAVRGVIADTRLQRHRHMRLTIVKQRDKLELVMKHFLMEDAGVDGSPSYVDFLCHMHKEIRTLLS